MILNDFFDCGDVIFGRSLADYALSGLLMIWDIMSHRAIPCAGDYALSGQVCFVCDIFNVLCKLCA